MAERDDTAKYESEFRHIPTGDTSSQEFQVIKAKATAGCNHGDLSSRALVLSAERRRSFLGPIAGSTGARPRDIPRDVFPCITE